MNKLLTSIPALILVIAICGCTNNGNGGNGTIGEPPESLNWCIPGEKWSGYVAALYFDQATIHGISNMYTDWRCHVRSEQVSGLVVDAYMTDMNASDVWAKTDMLEMHYINGQCTEGDC